MINGDLISKERLQELISRYAPESYGVVNKLINQLPTIEAEPIKHGRWIKRGDNSWECFVCHEISCCNGNYCVDCGAKMDEVEE